MVPASRRTSAPGAHVTSGAATPGSLRTANPFPSTVAKSAPTIPAAGAVLGDGEASGSLGAVLGFSTAVADGLAVECRDEGATEADGADAHDARTIPTRQRLTRIRMPPNIPVCACGETAVATLKVCNVADCTEATVPDCRASRRLRPEAIRSLTRGLPHGQTPRCRERELEYRGG